MRDGDEPGSSEIPFAPAGPTKRTNGVHPEGLHTHPVPLERVEEPIDLVAVQADDELINALAAGMSVSAPGVHGYDADDRVAAVLAAWKAEVDAEPIPELIDVDSAVAIVESARPAPSRRLRHLAPIAAAAAFVAIAAAGVSAGSASAEPDSVLWPVSKVLFSERATSVEAADRAEVSIDNAKVALVNGEPAVAAMELQEAKVELASVRPQEGQVQLADVQDFLAAKADETAPGQPTDPGAPLMSDSARPVPPGAAMAVEPSASAPAQAPPESGVPTTAAPVGQPGLPVVEPEPAPVPATSARPAPTGAPGAGPAAPPTSAPAPAAGTPAGPATTTSTGMRATTIGPEPLPPVPPPTS